MKRTALILLAALAIIPCLAKKRKSTKLQNILPTAIRNFPSGAIDEYHYRPGTIVVRGCVRNANASLTNWSFTFTGYDQFTNESFVETIQPDSTGYFYASFAIPHTQFFRLGGFQQVFAAVGDTLDLNIIGVPGTLDCTVTGDGTGVTGEVNRVWPLLDKQFHASELTDKPWEPQDRQIMLDWKRGKLEEMAAIARAIDTDTISLLDGCSDFAKDVLKSSLLSCMMEQIGEAFDQYTWRVMDEKRQTPPEKLIRDKEIWDFLHQCQSYVLDNPCMLFACQAEYMVNQVEFGPLGAYIFLCNGLTGAESCADPDWLINYKQEFILPSTYDAETHRQMLAHRHDSLLSVSDYYRMATDTICSIYGLRPNFMMELCLAHCIQAAEDEEYDSDYRHIVAERFAAAIPQITSPIISQHITMAYRQFVARSEAGARTASASPQGDSIFNALVDRYRGNVLAVDFWGLGCAPCRTGMLEQRSVVEYFRDKPVRFLYLCNENSSPREASEAFMKENNIKGEHIYLTNDEWNYLTKKFQFVGIPFYILVDRRGNIRQGHISKYEIEELLKQ